jgi:hypothetical protein
LVVNPKKTNESKQTNRNDRKTIPGNQTVYKVAGNVRIDSTTTIDYIPTNNPAVTSLSISHHHHHENGK